MFLDHGYTYCETEPREEEQSLNVVLNQGYLEVFQILKSYENVNQTLFTFQMSMPLPEGLLGAWSSLLFSLYFSLWELNVNKQCSFWYSCVAKGQVQFYNSVYSSLQRSVVFHLDTER